MTNCVNFLDDIICECKGLLIIKLPHTKSIAHLSYGLNILVALHKCRSLYDFLDVSLEGTCLLQLDQRQPN
jgi:hypothetical protein